MKNLALNIVIIGLVLLAYHFEIFDLFNSKYALWIIGFIIFLLFLAALKILGNPLAKDDDDD